MSPTRVARVITNADSLNEVSRSLLDALGKAAKGNSLRRPKGSPDKISSPHHTDIVGEKACDDIVKYLAPTLEQHKGCSIIDVHPGSCVFSRKVHDYLKPERHLLMEPDERYVTPFIKPLLDQPNSTYRHTTLTGAHPTSYWRNYARIREDPKLLPPRPALPVGDPQRRQLDPSLLVIGNLERYYTDVVSHRFELANMMLLQMSLAALANELFHQSGLVRMLWWIPERVKTLVLPRNTLRRVSMAAIIEAGLEPTEVAGIAPIQVKQDQSMHWRKRLPMYDRLGIDQVAERMRDRGMSAPEGRSLLGVDYQEHVDAGSDAHRSPFVHLADTPSGIRKKITRAREDLQAIVRTSTKERLDSAVFPQSKRMLDYLSTKSVPRARAALLTDVMLQILHLEASYKQLEERGQHKTSLEELKTDILKVDEEFVAKVVGFGDLDWNVLQVITEDMLAFYASSQSSPLDRRAYEPLKIDSTDFFPPGTELTLIDCMPKARDLTVPDLADNKEGAKVCQHMLSTLYSTSIRNLVDTLNVFAVNAGQDLVPMVPAITDPRRGGRLNPKRVRTRMLTEEMTEGLVKAFFEWPFRPDTREFVVNGKPAAAEEESKGEVEDESVEAAEL